MVSGLTFSIEAISLSDLADHLLPLQVSVVLSLSVVFAGHSLFSIPLSAFSIAPSLFPMYMLVYYFFLSFFLLPSHLLSCRPFPQILFDIITPCFLLLFPLPCVLSFFLALPFIHFLSNHSFLYFALSPFHPCSLPFSPFHRGKTSGGLPC